MKRTFSRILALLLTFALPLSVLCACGGKEENASSGTAESSGAPSGDVSSGSEESSAPDPEIEKIRSFLSEEPDRTLKAKNLFAGMSYTYSAKPDGEHADSGKMLTDGETLGLYNANVFVSFPGNGSTEITFDLGEGEHRLAEVCVDCLKKESYGIALPKRVWLAASDDGESFTTLCTQLAPTASAPESCKFVFTLALPAVTEARYIRVGVSSAADPAYIDEITGYEYAEDGTIDRSGEKLVYDDRDYDLYGYSLTKEVTTPASPEDADWKTFQNLALLEGASVTASHFEPLTEAYAAENTGKDGLKKLIDGKKAQNAVYSDPAMVVFFRGTGRHVVIDLGNEMAVSRVGGEFLTYTSAGVRVPAFIMVSVSTDGEKWTTVNDGETGQYMKEGTELYDFGRDLGDKFLARYVRFSFVTRFSYETTVEVNCTELEVWGTKDTSGAREAYTPAGLTGGSYPDPEKLGFRNILWSCSGYIDKGNAFTYENSLPYFGVSDGKKITGRLFDSVVVGGIYAMRFPDDAKPWVEKLVEEFTRDGYNLSALDEISGTLLSELGDGKKLMVWISLICPNSGFACSDIDGDGKAEDFSTQKDCDKFLKWEIDLFRKAIAEKNYQNIEFAGFYWNNEAIAKSEYDLQCATIQEMNRYLHSLGLRSIWAPYYGAYGIWAWKEVGFDVAVFQPNYMFNAEDTTRLKSASDIALIHGMGIELEIEDYTGEIPIRMYREYLRAGYDYGYMNGVNALYQGSIPGALVKSLDIELSKVVYEDTVLFAEGKLDETYLHPEAADLSAFRDSTVRAEKGKSVDLNPGAELKAGDGIRLRLVRAPCFGVFRLNSDGSMRYSPLKGYTGEEAVVFELSDGAGNRKTVTVTIEVALGS